tara:strand:- start:2606 stop:2926 length:321 start_codon:yes stop_codon:yes gene_type:complete
MTYLILIGAILFEVMGTLLLPVSRGFTKPFPSIALLVLYGLSFYFLSIASQRLPLAIIYATWAGMGVFLVTSLSIVIYKQSLNLQTFFGLVMVVTGVAIIHIYKVS